MNQMWGYKRMESRTVDAQGIETYSVWYETLTYTEREEAKRRYEKRHCIVLEEACGVCLEEVKIGVKNICNCSFLCCDACLMSVYRTTGKCPQCRQWLPN